MSMLPSTRSRVVAASFMTQALVIGSVFAYGVYFTVLEEELGWSRTLLSASSSAAFLVMGLFAVLVGRLNDQFGPRWVLSTTGALSGLGYIFMSSMTQPWQLVLYFGAFIGIGMAAHDVVTLSTIAAWFDRRRGIVTGVVKTGTACGQIALPLISTALIINLGWRQSMLVMGIGAAIGLVLVAQWMQKPGAQQAVSHKSGVQKSGPHTDELQTSCADKAQTQPASVDRTGGISFTEARRSRTLWVMCAIQFCFFPSLMTVPLHIVSHARDLGASTQNAALVLSALGAASIIGRLVIGFLFDKIGGRLALKTCLILLVLGLFSLLLIDSVHWLYFFALIYGCAHGGLFTVISPTIAEYFGMQAHGAVFGMIVMFGTFSGAVGPVVAGAIFDFTGSYQIAFQILIIMACAGLMLTASLRPVRPTSLVGAP